MIIQIRSVFYPIHLKKLNNFRLEYLKLVVVAVVVGFINPQFLGKQK